MEVELLEIRDFLAAHHPFDRLPAEELERLPESLELGYLRRDREVYRPDAENNYLYIIRSGAVEIFDENGALLSRLGEGETFGSRSLRRGRTLYHARTIEDTLFYKLPRYRFNQLCERHETFAFYYHVDGAQRLRDAVQSGDSGDAHTLGMMTLKISDIINPNWITLPASTPINEAAAAMTEKNASSILVCQDDRLAGIVTDRDMCSRCLAAGLDTRAPLARIMTASPVSISENDYAATAMMVMSRHNIRHLPVVDEDRVKGIVNISDLIQHQSASPVYLVADIYRQNSIEQLAETSLLIPRVLVQLVEADASAYNIGRMISYIGEAITARLLQLAEEALGPAPVDYCWLNFGSMARQEQTARTDQDNGILVSDAYNAAEHDTWFKQLATFVSDGLNACGYDYCPGNIMATNERWRRPLKDWKKYFSDWINRPEPKALMHASIFFDMRCIYGEKELFRQLKRTVTSMAKGNSIFLAHLTGNALHHSPPLGFFRRFVLVHDGKHDNTLDLKHNGIVPIIDLARIFTLASGETHTNTQTRLLAVAGKGEVSRSGAEDLVDALELISKTRCRHQAEQIRQGKRADNFLSPDDISNLERNYLKDAFEVVRTMQSALGQRYQAGRF